MVTGKELKYLLLSSSSKTCAPADPIVKVVAHDLTGRVAFFLARETLQLLIGWRMPTSRTKRTVVQPSLKKNPSLYS